MKLDRAGAPHTQPLASEHWTMEMEQEGAQHLAIVSRRGVPMCRVSVISAHQDDAGIRTALADKARAWIVEFERREQGGAT